MTERRSSTSAPIDEGVTAEFLDLVARRVAASGYGDVSVRDLAAEGGVSIHAFYRDFGTKAGLLAGVLNRAVNVEVSRSRRHPSSPSSVSGRWRRYRERASLRALAVEAAAVARRDPALRQALRDEQRKHFDACVAACRDWQRDGELADDIDPEALVALLWAAEAGTGILEALGIELGSGPKVATVVGRLLDSLRSAR